MTIRAERTPRSRDGVKWLASERPNGSFYRQFTLGEGIDTEGITANYDNGVLGATVPVSERAKPRTISVQAAERVTAADSKQAVAAPASK